ncbi:MAG TPA: acylphosphatase [Candidatus Acidoferrum sp.]|nr:acylphosphatase [Candidatus Acidoferrum sp.]
MAERSPATRYFLRGKSGKQLGSATILRFVSETRSAKRYFVSGMVQGVGFRFFTQRAAEKLNVSGFVRNLRDGRVEVFAMGTAEQHNELRRLLERGPLGFGVSEVIDEPAPVETQYDGGFVINSTA